MWPGEGLPDVGGEELTLSADTARASATLYDVTDLGTLGGATSQAHANREAIGGYDRARAAHTITSAACSAVSTSVLTTTS